MIYKGNICDGCGKAFEENDDIVVCPDCATPQHRECYEKNDKCVNSHLHGEDWSWKGQTVRSVPSILNKNKEEKPDIETSPCPNCGHENPKGAKECENCSMKLVVFGIDLATEIKEQNRPPQNKGQNKNIPSYDAPFTLGVGEGFENEEAPVRTENTEQTDIPFPPSAEQVEKSVIENMMRSGRETYQNSTVGGVHIKLLASLLGSNAYKYIEKFKRMELGKKVSFNWASFFFSPYWFFYRKLYKIGIVFMTVSVALTVLFMPSYVEFSEFMMRIAENPEAFAAMDEAAFNLFYDEYMSQLLPMAAMGILQFVLHIVAGFAANPLLKKETLKNAKTVIQAKTKGEAAMLVSKLGGVSALALLGAFVAEEAVSMLISYLMF